MDVGKLYRSNDEHFVANVEYQLQNKAPENWWGELILMEYGRISDGGWYVIELEDKRKGTCYLKKRVNRAVSGLPPRYVYHFSGTSLMRLATPVTKA